MNFWSQRAPGHAYAPKCVQVRFCMQMRPNAPKCVLHANAPKCVQVRFCMQMGLRAPKCVFACKCVYAPKCFFVTAAVICVTCAKVRPRAFLYANAPKCSQVRFCMQMRPRAPKCAQVRFCMQMRSSAPNRANANRSRSSAKVPWVRFCHGSSSFITTSHKQRAVFEGGTFQRHFNPNVFLHANVPK